MATTPSHTTQDVVSIDDAPFTVQDRRRKGYFTIDNELLDTYGAELGPFGLAVYLALALFADQESECYPSQKTIAKRTGMSRMQVSREIEKLKELKIIGVENQYGAKGEQRSNLYILLDVPPVTESYTPCNMVLHPPVTDSYTPCNTVLHKQNIVNNTTKQQDNVQQHRRPRERAKAIDTDRDVVVALTSLDITETTAQRLAKRYSRDHIEEKIAFLSFLLQEQPDKVKSPGGWLRRAIEENYAAPDGYVSAEEREQRRQEAERQDAQETAQAESHTAALNAAAAEQASRLQRRREQYGATEDDVVFWAEAREAIRDTTTPHVYELVAETELLQLGEDTVRIGVRSVAEQRQLTHPGSVKAIERTLSRLAGRPVALQVEVLT